MTAWSDRRQHAGEDLEAEVLFVAQPVRAALEHADLVVQPRPDALSASLRRGRARPGETPGARGALSTSQPPPVAARARSCARPPVDPRRPGPAPVAGGYRDRSPRPGSVSWRRVGNGFGNPDL